MRIWKTFWMECWGEEGAFGLLLNPMFILLMLFNVGFDSQVYRHFLLLREAVLEMFSRFTVAYQQAKPLFSEHDTSSSNSGCRW